VEASPGGGGDPLHVPGRSDGAVGGDGITVGAVKEMGPLVDGVGFAVEAVEEETFVLGEGEGQGSLAAADVDS